MICLLKPFHSISTNIDHLKTIVECDKHIKINQIRDVNLSSPFDFLRNIVLVQQKNVLF